MTNVAPGDAVICTRWSPAACARRAAPATTCTARTPGFPGIDTDGGMAELLLTNARSVGQAGGRPGAEGRRRAGRRGAHRVPRRAPGHPAVSRHHLHRHRGRRPRPHRHSVPGRDDRGQGRRGRPEREGPGAGAGTSARARSGPTATNTGLRARTSCSTSWGSGGAEKQGPGDDPPGRQLLRDRVRRHDRHSDIDLISTEPHHRQPGQLLQRPRRPDDPRGDGRVKCSPRPTR